MGKTSGTKLKNKRLKIKNQSAKCKINVVISQRLIPQFRYLIFDFCILHGAFRHTYYTMFCAGCISCCLAPD